MKAVLCKAFDPADTLVVEEISSPETKTIGVANLSVGRSCAGDYYTRCA